MQLTVKMADFEETFEVEDVVTVSAGKAQVEFDWRKMPAAQRGQAIARAIFGFPAKVGNDSASSAATYMEKHNADPKRDKSIDIDEAREILISSWINARYASGSFGRVSGVGESAETVEAKRLLREIIKAQAGAKYNKASPEVRAMMVEAAWEAMAEDAKKGLLADARDELARKREESERRAKVVASLGDLGIKL